MRSSPEQSSPASLLPPAAPPRARLPNYLRSLLLLGRVSNLPTVWSNCLAAWLIAGAGPWRGFLFLLGGASLLYLAGMFLNDAVDAPWDRQFRPERPIPAEQVSRRAVLAWSIGLLVSGALLMLPLGTQTLELAAGLMGAIIIYDLIHKKTDLAPFLIGGCRFLLYLTAAASAKRGQIGIVLVPALGMAAYVTGLSLFARREAKGGRSSAVAVPDQASASSADAPPAPAARSVLVRWSVAALAIALLALPLVLNVTGSRLLHWDRTAILAGAGLWILFCLRHGLRRERADFSHGVPGLLAGIVLIDWLAAPALVPLQPALFGGLFVLALILQKIVPAT